MALVTVEGIYEDGKIALAERPAGIERARVRVTFLPEEAGSDLAEQEAAAKEQARQEAVRRLLASMEKGINFGGEKFNREEIYEERLRELDERRSG